MEPEQQAEWFAGSGYLPVNALAAELPAAREVIAKYPQFQVPLDLYLESPTTPAALGAVLGPFYQVREALYQGIEAMGYSSRTLTNVAWVAERIAPSQRIEISVTREPILTMRALWTLMDETAAAATAAPP